MPVFRSINSDISRIQIALLCHSMNVLTVNWQTDNSINYSRIIKILIKLNPPYIPNINVEALNRIMHHSQYFSNSSLMTTLLVAVNKLYWDQTCSFKKKYSQHNNNKAFCFCLCTYANMCHPHIITTHFIYISNIQLPTRLSSWGLKLLILSFQVYN